MAFLLREGEGKGVALYTRCEDVLLAKAELLLLKEEIEKDKRFTGKPIYGYLDVDPTFTISRFMASYRVTPEKYRRLKELRKLILSGEWNYREVEL